MGLTHICVTLASLLPQVDEDSSERKPPHLLEADEPGELSPPLVLWEIAAEFT